jgi:hypothetical protein
MYKQPSTRCVRLDKFEIHDSPHHPDSQHRPILRLASPPHQHHVPLPPHKLHKLRLGHALALTFRRTRPLFNTATLAASSLYDICLHDKDQLFPASRPVFFPVRLFSFPSVYFLYCSSILFSSLRDDGQRTTESSRSV